MDLGAIQSTVWVAICLLGALEDTVWVAICLLGWIWGPLETQLLTRWFALKVRGGTPGLRHRVTDGQTDRHTHTHSHSHTF